MNEKTYKTMSRVGCSNIALGVVVLVVGIVAGVLTIISGAQLVKEKYKVTI